LKTIKKARKHSYDRSAKRPGGPIPKLSYDPLENAENMHRFLKDLINWTLSGRIRARQASVCRAMIETELQIEGYGDVSKRIDEIESTYQEARRLLERAKRESQGVALTPDEQVSYAHLIRAAERENHGRLDQAWLSSRPQDEQDIARKLGGEEPG
jgi:hypothetical protein